MSEHAWKDYRGTPACSLCGVVRRADDRNKPCSGKTPIVTTRITASATDADAYCLDVFAPDPIPEAPLTLSTDDIEALRMLRVMLREDADVYARYGWQQRYRVAERVLDRLTGAKP